MSMYPQSNKVTLGYATERDLSIPKFFNQVYAWMCVGLAVTAIVGFLARNLVYTNPLIAVAAMLGLFVLAVGTRQVTMKLSAGAGLAMFVLYAACVGAAISYIFVRYRMETLLGAFFVTGGTFAAMSVVGFVTKKDLSGMGGFLYMAVIGLFLASIFNVFFANNALSWFITYAVLLVFIAFTAYDTQKLREMALAHKDNPAMLSRIAVLGSLELYLDFVNMFLSILRIMGNRR